MKKKLNVDSIQSELRGGSAFFPGYKSADSPTSQPEKSNQVAAPDSSPKEKTPVTHQKNLEGVPPPVPRPVRGTVSPTPLLVPKVKRPIKQRQPFDIYEDQYEQLKRIATAEREFINGRSMSHMVREAIDLYLKSHPATEK
jgi:hypothetical protein